MNAQEVRRVILAVQKTHKAVGTFFSAKNIKKDKTERTWNCRFGVKKGDRGGEMSYDPQEKDLLIVWDKKRSTDPRSAKRALAVSTLKELKVCGVSLVENGKPTDKYNEVLNSLT